MNTAKQCVNSVVDRVINTVITTEIRSKEKQIGHWEESVQAVKHSVKAFNVLRDGKPHMIDDILETLAKDIPQELRQEEISTYRAVLAVFDFSNFVKRNGDELCITKKGTKTLDLFETEGWRIEAKVESEKKNLKRVFGLLRN